MVHRVVLWGTGVGVVLSAVTGALVNELHAGWPWWVASGAAVIGSAALAMWIAALSASSRPETGKPASAVHQAIRVSDGGDAYVVGKGELRADE